MYNCFCGFLFALDVCRNPADGSGKGKLLDTSVILADIRFLREVFDEAALWKRRISSGVSSGSFCRLCQLDALCLME